MTNDENKRRAEQDKRTARGRDQASWDRYRRKLQEDGRAKKEENSRKIDWKARDERKVD